MLLKQHPIQYLLIPLNLNNFLGYVISTILVFSKPHNLMDPITLSLDRLIYPTILITYIILVLSAFIKLVFNSEVFKIASRWWLLGNLLGMNIFLGYEFNICSSTFSINSFMLFGLTKSLAINSIFFIHQIPQILTGETYWDSLDNIPKFLTFAMIILGLFNIVIFQLAIIAKNSTKKRGILDYIQLSFQRISFTLIVCIAISQLIIFLGQCSLWIWLLITVFLRLYSTHLEPLYARYFLPIASEIFLTPQLPSEEYFSLDANSTNPNYLFTNAFGGVMILATFIIKMQEILRNRMQYVHPITWIAFLIALPPAITSIQCFFRYKKEGPFGQTFSVASESFKEIQHDLADVISNILRKKILKKVKLFIKISKEKSYKPEYVEFLRNLIIAYYSKKTLKKISIKMIFKEYFAKKDFSIKDDTVKIALQKRFFPDKPKLIFPILFDTQIENYPLKYVFSTCNLDEESKIKTISLLLKECKFMKQNRIIFDPPLSCEKFLHQFQADIVRNIAVKKILLGYSTVNPAACIFDIYEDIVDERI